MVSTRLHIEQLVTVAIVVIWVAVLVGGRGNGEFGIRLSPDGLHGRRLRDEAVHLAVVHLPCHTVSVCFIDSTIHSED